jgi:hypothetical protein
MKRIEGARFIGGGAQFPTSASIKNARSRIFISRAI